MSARRVRPSRSGVPFAFVGAGLIAVAIVALVLRWPSEDAARPTGLAGPSTASPTALVTSPSPAAVLIAPPSCQYLDERTRLTAYAQWPRTVLDTRVRLPQDYAPPDLASTATAGFAEGLLVRRGMIDDLAALREAAEAAGSPVDVIATYRSFAQQGDLFERRVEELGYDEALRRVARPGHSEHQLGTAVDFRTPGEPDVTVAWAGTPEGRWMEANAWRFGFVESYPQGGMDRTCYSYEPWHYRYLGRGLAARVQASGLTLREYLWHWQETGSEP